MSKNIQNHTEPIRAIRVRIRVVPLLTLGLLLLLVPTLLAQSGGYDLSWWTADGGGGTLQDGEGRYSLDGTAGQPDARVWGGAGYALTGGFWSGTASEEHPAPTAAFSASPVTGTAPLEVQFTDHSSGNIVVWAWDFGDDSASGARHPAHEYTQPGVYTVTLAVSGPGGSDTEIKTGYITVYAAVEAAFSATPVTGTAPLEVQFTDYSAGSIVAWAWDFGDGGVSGGRHPAHEYVDPGVYTVTLSVAGPGGTDRETRARYITVYAPVEAMFAASPISGTAPLEVQFTDYSAGSIVAWAWDFGDGGMSGARHPAHEYTQPGVYTVTLTAAGPDGTDTLVRANYITVLPDDYKTWTFMLYLAGDNNLHQSLKDAIDRMERMENKPNLDVLVLWDGLVRGDTRLYHVQYDTRLGIVSSPIAAGWNLGELNMGNAQTLVDFVTWARKNYPADHYLLSIANHGRGTSGIAWDDASSGDRLSAYSELERAMNDITSGGDKIDVLYLDACLMGMIEDAYEVKDAVDYIVASENLGWSVFAYDAYISGLAENTTPRQLAQNIAKTYMAALRGYPGTISVLDMASIGQVGNAVDKLAQAATIYLSPTTISRIINARNLVQTFDSRNYLVLDSSDEYVDLYHLAELVKVSVDDAAVRDAAQAVMDAVEASVVVEYHRSAVDVWSRNYWDLDDAHGLAIYFPPRSGGWDYANYVTGGSWAFGSQTAWDEFLVAYFGISGLPGEDPVDPGTPPMQAVKEYVFLPVVLRNR